jgi:hypothetical protein
MSLSGFKTSLSSFLPKQALPKMSYSINQRLTPSPKAHSGTMQPKMPHPSTHTPVLFSSLLTTAYPSQRKFSLYWKSNLGHMLYH